MPRISNKRRNERIRLGRLICTAIDGLDPAEVYEATGITPNMARAWNAGGTPRWADYYLEELLQRAEAIPRKGAPKGEDVIRLDTRTILAVISTEALLAELGERTVR